MDFIKQFLNDIIKSDAIKENIYQLMYERNIWFWSRQETDQTITPRILLLGDNIDKLQKELAFLEKNLIEQQEALNKGGIIYKPELKDSLENSEFGRKSHMLIRFKKWNHIFISGKTKSGKLSKSKIYLANQLNHFDGNYFIEAYNSGDEKERSHHKKIIKRYKRKEDIVFAASTINSFYNNEQMKKDALAETFFTNRLRQITNECTMIPEEERFDDFYFIKYERELPEEKKHKDKLEYAQEFEAELQNLWNMNIERKNN